MKARAKRIHHMAISTPDLDRARAFYCDLLGAEPLADESEIPANAVTETLLRDKITSGRMVILSFGGSNLELFEFQTPEAQGDKYRSTDHGFFHLAFEVDDCVAAYKRMMAAGMDFHNEPSDIGDGCTFVWGRDPDGNIIELITEPDDSNYGRGPKPD